MPRGFWWLLAVMALGLCWFGLRRPMLVSTPVSGSRVVICALPPSMTDPSQPLQSNNDARMPPFRLGHATVTPLAGISLQARVLSREDYSLGTEATYSPTDLALGWGPMANPEIYRKLDISQGGRWFNYRWGNEGPPIPLDQIITHAANMHMVPSDRQIAKTLASVDDDDTVRIDGWLIRIDSDAGWHWQSSLTRNDSGNGACELVYVCSIHIE